MILARNRERLSEDVLSLIGTSDEEDILETFKKKLQEEIDYVNKLINTDYDKLSNVDFYYLIRDLYSITLTERDFLNFISKKRNKEYTYFKIIPTTMVFNDYKSEGKGKNFSYWKQPYQIFVDVALAEDANIDSKKNYSSIDIKNMYDKNKITVLEYDSIELEEYISDIEELEEYPAPELKLAKSIIPDNDDYKEEFDFYISALRRKLTKKFVLNDLYKYVEDLNEELYNIFLFSSMSYGYGLLSNRCKEWFKTTSIGDELNGITKRLSKGDY